MSASLPTETRASRPTTHVRPRALGATVLGLALIAASTLPASRAPAQESVRSLNDLVLAWMQGHYASPVLCEFERGPTRGIRRISILSGPVRVRPPANRLRFVDLEADDAQRCVDDLGGAQHNIIGSLLVRMPGARSNSDSVERDFRNSLRREHGFELSILEGILRVERIGNSQSVPEIEDLDFSGGTVRLKLAAAGSETALQLREFESTRKALLELRTKGGRAFAFPVFATEPPQADRTGARD